MAEQCFLLAKTHFPTHPVASATYDGFDRGFVYLIQIPETKVLFTYRNDIPRQATP